MASGVFPTSVIPGLFQSFQLRFPPSFSLLQRVSPLQFCHYRWHIPAHPRFSVEGEGDSAVALGCPRSPPSHPSRLCPAVPHCPRDRALGCLPWPLGREGTPELGTGKGMLQGHGLGHLETQQISPSKMECSAFPWQKTNPLSLGMEKSQDHGILKAGQTPGSLRLEKAPKIILSNL